MIEQKCDKYRNTKKKERKKVRQGRGKMKDNDRGENKYETRDKRRKWMDEERRRERN